MIGRKRPAFDLPLSGATLLLVAIGVFFVFSSSSFMASERYGQAFHFMVQQVLGAAAGIAIVVFLVSVKKPFFLQPAFVMGLLGLTAGLLVLCLAMPSVAHTNRWIVLGGLRFQPSELAKISLVLFLATYVESRRDKLNDLKTLAVPAIVLVVMVVLVLVEPDFGTAVLLAAIAAMLLFIGGVKLRYLAAAGAVAAVVFGFYLFRADYRVER
ncbi:MAG TPA: FtsW/RodA/SpoVE family cell cycle protein, partial [Acidobacteriota bacterium]|nr:FtsW/RodA/SpoVE family cell cycle protein [Acidobacteriota bacterium]